MFFSRKKNETFFEHHIIGGKEFPFTIYTSSRKSASISINDGEVVVRMPNHLSKKEQNKLIDELIEKLEYKLIDNTIVTTPFYYNDFESYFSVTTEKFKRKTVKGFLDGNSILIKIPDNIDESLLEKEINREKKKCIAEFYLPIVKDTIISYQQKHFPHITLGKISIRNFKSRWGSCSVHKNIFISYTLLGAPREVLEYVCLHELVHCVEFSHSKRFWQIMASIMPDYKKRKQWLKKYHFHSRPKKKRI